MRWPAAFFNVFFPDSQWNLCTNIAYIYISLCDNCVCLHYLNLNRISNKQKKWHGICNSSFISSQMHCLKSPHVFRHIPLFFLFSGHDNTHGGRWRRKCRKDFYHQTEKKKNFLINNNHHHHVILMTQRLPQLFTLIDCEISIGINSSSCSVSFLFFTSTVCEMRNNRNWLQKKVTMTKRENRKNWQNSWHTDEYGSCCIGTECECLKCSFRAETNEHF